MGMLFVKSLIHISCILNSVTGFAQNLINKSDISDIIYNVLDGSRLNLSDYLRLLESEDV